MGNVTAVIATYREEYTIKALVRALKYQGMRVIVVDDSDDATPVLAKQGGADSVIIRKGERGIASAYNKGFVKALAEPGVEWIVQIDAGGTHDPRDLPNMLTHGRLGAGLVIGSRFMIDVPHLSRRTAISHGAAWLMRRLGVRVSDATSGYRVWSRDVLEAVLVSPIRAEGFAFQLELLYRAHRAGATIVEVAIPYRLTNSSFNWGMVWEALRIYGGLWRDHILHRTA